MHPEATRPELVHAGLERMAQHPGPQPLPRHQPACQPQAQGLTGVHTRSRPRPFLDIMQLHHCLCCYGGGGEVARQDCHARWERAPWFSSNLICLFSFGDRGKARTGGTREARTRCPAPLGRCCGWRRGAAGQACPGTRPGCEPPPRGSPPPAACASAGPPGDVAKPAQIRLISRAGFG